MNNVIDEIIELIKENKNPEARSLILPVAKAIELASLPASIIGEASGEPALKGYSRLNGMSLYGLKISVRDDIRVMDLE